MLRVLAELVSVALFALAIYLIAETQMTKTEEVRIYEVNDPKVVQLHYEVLGLYGIKFPLVVTAQEAHETNWFSSDIYLNNHNRFGMKINSRPFDKGERKGHAKYDDYIDSIRDYAAWQKQRLKENPWVKTEDDYLKMLVKVGYAEDPKYVDKIRVRMRQIRLLASSGSSSLANPN